MSVKELKIFSEAICKEVRQIDIWKLATTINIFSGFHGDGIRDALEANICTHVAI